MLRFTCLVALLVAAVALPAPHDPEPVYEPKPYSFNYDSVDDGGSHSHSQTSDGHKVTGQYEIHDEDGRHRIVEYIADELGFRATIKTNEPGTQNASPADVDFQSNPIDIAETPIKYSKPVVQPVHVPVEQPRPVAYRYVQQPRPAVRVVEQPAPVHYIRPQTTGVDTSRYVMVPIDQLAQYGYRH